MMAAPARYVLHPCDDRLAALGLPVVRGLFIASPMYDSKVEGWVVELVNAFARFPFAHTGPVTVDNLAWAPLASLCEHRDLLARLAMGEPLAHVLTEWSRRRVQEEEGKRCW